MHKQTEETCASFGDMGIAWDRNWYYQKLGEMFNETFSKDEIETGISDERMVRFIELSANGTMLNLFVRDMEKFEVFWGVRNKKKLVKEFDGFVNLCYRSLSQEFDLYFDINECKKRLANSDEKAIDLLAQKVEGYKMKRLFKSNIDWETFKGMALEVQKKRDEIVTDEFGKVMVKVIFNEILKEVEKRK